MTITRMPRVRLWPLNLSSAPVIPPIPPWPDPVLPSIPAGPNYYISPAGNDTTGDGSIGNPWRQLLKALDTVPVGAVIYCRAGTYANFFKNGRDTVWVTNYAGEDAYFERSTSGNVMNFENCRNVHIVKNPAGGTIIVRRTGTVASSGSVAGIRMYYLSSASPNLFGMSGGHEINGITVTTINGYGLYLERLTDVAVHNIIITDTGTGIRYANCTGVMPCWYGILYANQRMIVNDATAGNDNGAVGIALNTGTVGVEIAYCTFFDNYATSIDYGYDGGAIEIYQTRGNRIHDNVAYDNEGFIETGTSDAVTYPSDDNQIWNNIVWGRVSFDSPQDTPLMLIRTPTLVYNNTFYPTDGLDVMRIQQGAGGFFGDLTGTRVINNIFVPLAANNRCYMFNVATITDPDVLIDYNMIYNAGGAAMIVAERTGETYTQTDVERAEFFTDTGFGEHDIWGLNPMFENPSLNDFDLASGSPAIDAGAVVAPYTDSYHHNMGANWPSP